MNKMKVRFVNGINSDRVEVKIFHGAEPVFTTAYTYGYNASYNRKFARLAQEDHDNAIKYKWKGAHILKPFIGDILQDLAAQYKIPKSDIYYSGSCIMENRELTQIEVQVMLDRIKKEM